MGYILPARGCRFHFVRNWKTVYISYFQVSSDLRCEWTYSGLAKSGSRKMRVGEDGLRLNSNTSGGSSSTDIVVIR